MDYDYGCVYACATPIFLKDEIRIYYGASDYLHFGWRNGSLALATLRPDGFAGYEQDEASQPGVIFTKEIAYNNQEILINADIEQGGSVRVTFMDKRGQEISSSRLINRSVTNSRIHFESAIQPGNYQLKFEIDNAKLFSFLLSS